MLSPWWTRLIAWMLLVADDAHAGKTARLCKDVADFKDLQLRATRLVLCLVDSVGHNHLVQRTGVDAINSISAENAVSDQRKHLRSTLLLQQLGCACDRVRCVRQIVDQDSGTVCNVSNKHHGRILPVADLCGSALLVNERKGHAERIGDSGSALRTSSVGTDNHGLLVVGNVGLDVFAEEMAAVQVVDGDVEEALVLGV